MKPQLVSWQEKHASQGLVIIDIDNGRIDTKDRLKAEVDKGVKFPVLWDNGGKNCAAYGVRAYPSAYLVGVDGKVLWEGHPGPGDADVQKLIDQELAKVKKK
jgi:hypothetical protein